MIAPAKLKAVPVYRQCPLCYHGFGGVGRCYSTSGQTRYYKCNCCPHTWTAIVTLVRVEHRPVDLSER